MTSLAVPHTRFHASWLAGTSEFDGAHLDGAGLAEDYSLDALRAAEPFRQFVDALVADALPATKRPAGYVPCTYRWIVDGETFLGSLAIRHELNDFLLEEGGHIGYSVRPSARRRGHARQALSQALPLARGHGMERVLITCDEDNIGSRATIEGNGGIWEDSRNGKRRYWIDLAASTAA
ncbi:GNAT family N-acetyltransferase [Paenarthrobacter sp. Z7-10]|uniref:GNAT family N-acetyltransferase n=1 Tax=Paenarthrobacter sp. Z7-10 TaxID=2787635 RepID=UPI0022A9734C|nr:GNAT family N-acetyltransferase [Paenarthrobacter sp. Z7-10]MCZ2402282.1 GNAT family N-acetyltransferase [Paenarthrobacter sp. Z7-10]